MRLYKLALAAAFSLTILLPAYAGDINGIQGTGIKFGSQALPPSEQGGGQFSVNYPGVKNWTAWTAGEFGLPAPCAAQTGFDGDPAQGNAEPWLALV